MDDEFIFPMDQDEIFEAYENDEILNLKTYFDEQLNYYEEFDTYNGIHHIFVVELENWNDEIRRFADEILQD